MSHTKKKKYWSYSTGERGRNRVRAYEDPRAACFLIEYYETGVGLVRPKKKRISLGHRDKARAKQEADEAASELGTAQPVESPELTLQLLFEMYLGEVTPGKSESKQSHDLRAAGMFLEFFGGSREVHTLGLRDWNRFIKERRQGQISPPGNLNQGGVRNRQIAYDLCFLRATLEWASLASNGSGNPLLARNPLRRLPLPEERNPNRPLLHRERYEAMLEVAARVDWRFETLLVLAWETGHRIKSLRNLQWRDLDFENATIYWRAEHDKNGRDHATPLSSDAIEALDAIRFHHTGSGEAWLFPSPRDPGMPCSRHLPTKWWKRAEKLAGLDPVKRLGWHGCRRAFATELKTVPVPDILKLGGWSTSQTLEKCYQQPDMKTMRSALEGRRSIV